MTHCATTDSFSKSVTAIVTLCIGALVCAAFPAWSHESAPASKTDAALWHALKPPLSTRWSSEVSPTNALPEYPRPQLARPSLTRPDWMSLNGVWQYSASEDHAAPSFGKPLAGRILVPYPIESALSGVEKYSPHMVYRRLFSVPSSFLSDHQHVRLNFGAVNYATTVFVNGHKVVHHTGAYDAFGADITNALKPQGPQEIVVAVDSPLDASNIPLGKQRRKPSGIFYTGASGIWQSVWLEPVPATSIASFTATPDRSLKSFHLSTTTDGDAMGAKVKVQVFADGKQVGEVAGTPGKPMTLAIPKAHLWSPEDPFLYTFKIKLTSPYGTDAIESYAGMRSISIGTVRGKQHIMLNGKPIFLLATLDQGYWPDGIYTAPTDAALKFDIQKTKDMGFNTIRKHIKVEPARWYYWTDHLGMMVWQDMPAMPDSKPTAAQKANFRDEATRMVEQLKGVTSIIGWIPFNEGWGQWSVAAATEMGRQFKKEDPTRLVDNRSGANCCDMPGQPPGGDIIDWHLYQGPALPKPDATRAAIDGEHGGLTLTIPGHSWPSSPINPYGAVKNRADLTDGYVANTEVLRDQGAAKGLSGGVYTQITDVEGEHNGFFSYDRAVEKMNEAKVRAVNQSVLEAATRWSNSSSGTP